MTSPSGVSRRAPDGSIRRMPRQMLAARGGSSGQHFSRPPSVPELSAHPLARTPARATGARIFRIVVLIDTSRSSRQPSAACLPIRRGLVQDARLSRLAAIRWKSRARPLRYRPWTCRMHSMRTKFDLGLSITSIALQASRVVVSGKASLPDGALIRCEIWRGDFDGPYEEVLDALAQTQSGRFECHFEPPSPWRGVVSASAELRADRTQPTNVQAVIGSAGERLAYTDISGKGFAQVFVVRTEALP